MKNISNIFLDYCKIFFLLEAHRKNVKFRLEQIDNEWTNDENSFDLIIVEQCQATHHTLGFDKSSIDFYLNINYWDIVSPLFKADKLSYVLQWNIIPSAYKYDNDLVNILTMCF